MIQDLQEIIENAWEKSSQITTETTGKLRGAVHQTLDLLDSGDVRISYKDEDGVWQVNEWAKKAILLSFRLNDMSLIESDINFDGVPANWYDKVPSKFCGWDEKRFKQAGFRAVPGCFVRHSAYIAKNVVVMPSFVNLGAYIDEGTMIDTWATVGSCAQIGKDCHISAGVVIGGVLEPLQANPVIIEDNCFIGANSGITEGVVIGKGSVISMGVSISASTKIVDRNTGEIYVGKVPPYSVIVPGSIPNKDAGKPSLYAAVIVKQVDEKTLAKTGVNGILRDVS